MLCPVKNLMVSGRQWFTASFSNGPGPGSFEISGGEDWPNMTPWRVLPGFGRPLMDRTLRPRLRTSLLDRIQRIGEKNGSKRHLLVDENGIPLSLVVTGANRHDSIALDPLLKARIADQGEDPLPQNLCLDAAYVGKEEVVIANGFIPHIRPRGEEKQLIERDPTFKARRWVVELAHSWFNRFRKLVPRYEKSDLSYNALNALAAAMIVLNKVIVIYR